MNIPTKITGFRSRILNALIDAVRAREVVNSDDIVAAKTPAGTKLRIRKNWETLGFPYGSRWTWGIYFSGDTVSIFNPKIVQGLVTLRPADPTPLAVAYEDNGNILEYEYKISDGTALLSMQETERDSDATYVRVALYRLSITDAVTGPPAVPVTITSWTKDLCHDACMPSGNVRWNPEALSGDGDLERFDPTTSTWISVTAQCSGES